MADMRLLIYGAGVIGSTYAVYFSKVGYDVSVYARGKRLEELETKGLCYPEKGKIRLQMHIMKQRIPQKQEKNCRL
jgi:ketopantoate reductase